MFVQGFNFSLKIRYIEKYLCMCSNANPLHYYVLRVPRKVDRWRWVWSIFESCIAWADHIVCGMSIYIVREKVEVRMTVSVTVCVVLLCCMEWWWKEGEGDTRCRLIAFSSRKVPRGPPGLTSPSDGRIAINSTICLLNIHTAEGFGI